MHAILAFHFNCIGGNKAAVAVHDFHLALFRQLRETAGELANHLVLEAGQFVQLDFGLAESDAVRRHFRGFGNNLRGVQQGFGWNAADIEANTADVVVAFNQYHLLAEIGGAESGGVAAGAGAEHHYFGVFVAFAGVGAGGRLRLLFDGLVLRRFIRG